MQLRTTYIDEEGSFPVPCEVLIEMGLESNESMICLSEKNNCAVITKAYNTLPLCDASVFNGSIWIDELYCTSRGLFSSKKECRHPMNPDYKIYRLQYYVEDKALIIPLEQEYLQEDYYHYQELQGNRLFFPYFIEKAVGLHRRTFLKLEVRDYTIFCRKCPESESITYHQTITYDSAEITFKEQLFKVDSTDVNIENFILNASNIRSNDPVRLKLTKKDEFVIEPVPEYFWF